MLNSGEAIFGWRSLGAESEARSRGIVIWLGLETGLAPEMICSG